MYKVLQLIHATLYNALGSIKMILVLWLRVSAIDCCASLPGGAGGEYKVMKRDVTEQTRRKKLGNLVGEGTSSGYRWKLLGVRVRC